ncbi:unnamed protein product [Mycena citricolor]|uniref:NCA2-domain-containing protein n=1 Tax=Mycena citricolor TaxID=2018698 RepID=A0AAD2HSR7_9AGAR|nr:unnamed protein product [Mycena citricolor]
MSRLRVDSTRFAANFARPLSARFQAPSTASFATFQSLQTSETTEKLRSFLVLLQQPAPEPSTVDAALAYLAETDNAVSLLSQESSELRSAVLNQATVCVYSRALETYLNEAVAFEAEAEWWANVERSNVNVAWFLLQTFPSRFTRALNTILAALREHHLPLNLASFSPSSLIRLFPSTALRPSALTRALFPHLEDGTAMTSSMLPPRSHIPSLIWSSICQPLSLARDECRYKRQRLEQLRDNRADKLGDLAALRSSASSQNSFLQHGLARIVTDSDFRAENEQNVVQKLSSSLLPAHIAAHAAELLQLSRPSRFTLIWPKLLLLPPLSLYAIRSLWVSRASMWEMALDAKETAQGFIKNSLVEPIKDILTTVRTGGGDGVIVRKEGVVADLDSLERMTLSLAQDQLRYNSTQLAELSAKIRVGDLTPVLRLYEEDIKSPVKSALTGTLLRSMFIQVQKAKVDIDQALAGIDKLLKSQELTFAFVGLAPAMVITIVLGRSLSSLLGSGPSDGRYGGKLQRAAAWAALRRIECLLTAKHRARPNTSSGMILISVARLRTFAESRLPKRSRLREGFLEDVTDLESTTMEREDKLRVVGRMWRTWGPALGWDKVPSEGSFTL